MLKDDVASKTCFFCSYSSFPVFVNHLPANIFPSKCLPKVAYNIFKNPPMIFTNAFIKFSHTFFKNNPIHLKPFGYPIVFLESESTVSLKVSSSKLVLCIFFYIPSAAAKATSFFHLFFKNVIFPAMSRFQWVLFAK